MQLNPLDMNFANCLRTSINPILGRLTHHRTPISAFRGRHPTSLVRCSATAAPPPPSPTDPATQLPRVILKGGKSKLFTDQQNPIVYGGAVDRVLGRPAPKTGDPVLVCSGDERAIGWGMYNPSSMYRVRLMQTAGEIPSDALESPDLGALLEARIAQAVSLRRTVGLPSAETTVYRAVNSEGDRLSGLVADVLGPQVVVSSSAAWVERQRDAIEALLLREIPGAEEVIWRRAAELAAEEGWEGEESPPPAPPQDEEGAPVLGTTHGGAVVLEGGAKFAVDPLGQKTGFYADQRDHRAFIRSLAAGRDVLDVCCYSGGFAIQAALGGATAAVGVDSSAAAVGLAERNAELNGVGDRCTFHKGDASEFMRGAAAEGKQWDLVVLDPPKLAPSRKALTGALRKYGKLNEQALRLVKPGGLLMTCSCSGAVAQSGDFGPMLQKAAARAGRRLAVVRVGSAGPDHCIDPGYPEGQYLTNVTVRVS